MAILKSGERCVAAEKIEQTKTVPRKFIGKDARVDAYCK